MFSIRYDVNMVYNPAEKLLASRCLYVAVNSAICHTYGRSYTSTLAFVHMTTGIV